VAEIIVGILLVLALVFIGVFVGLVITLVKTARKLQETGHKVERTTTLTKDRLSKWQNAATLIGGAKGALSAIREGKATKK